MTKFSTTPLEDLAELSGGFAFKSKDYAETGRFILRTLNITDDGTINKDQAVYLSLDLCPNYKQFELQENDTLFVMVGATLGKIGWIKAQDIPALLNQNMWRIRAKHNLVDPRFLNYAFRVASAKSLNWASGSARAFVRRDDYRKLSIPSPPIVTQRAISNLLGALDDKIENNRRMNETLEEMARAIFKSWFVDFDPVHAKVAGNVPAHMDAETAALFPNSFGDDGLPVGWNEGPMSDTIKLIGGGTPKTKEATYWGGDIKWFSVVDAPSSSDVWVIDTEKKITKEGLANSSAKLLPPNTTIISARGTVGKTALTLREISMNQSCYGIVGANGFPSFYTYFSVRRMVSQLQANAHGSVFDTITKDTFSSVKVVKPTIEISNEFDKTVINMMNEISNNLLENQTLAELRDSLLPKLMSGEIRLKDAEREVEAAV